MALLSSYIDEANLVIEWEVAKIKNAIEKKFKSRVVDKRVFSSRKHLVLIIVLDAVRNRFASSGNCHGRQVVESQLLPFDAAPEPEHGLPDGVNVLLFQVVEALSHALQVLESDPVVKPSQIEREPGLVGRAHFVKIPEFDQHHVDVHRDTLMTSVG